MGRELASIRATLGGAAITPSDTTVMAFETSAIYVGGAGTIVYVPFDGDATVTLLDCAAGAYYPIATSRVMATSTTATSLVAWYMPPGLDV